MRIFVQGPWIKEVPVFGRICCYMGGWSCLEEREGIDQEHFISGDHFGDDMVGSVVSALGRIEIMLHGS